MFDFVYFYIIANYFNIYPQYTDIQLWWGSISWIIVAYASAVNESGGIKTAATWGAFVGFMTFGVFNSVELMLHSNYRNLKPVLCDIMWGCVSQAILSSLVYYLCV